jgi:predicted DNA binding CopG/RHH family protein
LVKKELKIFCRSTLLTDKEAPSPDKVLRKSSAQVETSVAHPVRQKSSELKLGDQTERKSQTLGVRFQAEELVIIKLKAQAAGCPTNTYIRAAALKSDYKPPINPELHKTLLAINRELTAQGRNLNQIAKQMNSHGAASQEGMADKSTRTDSNEQCLGKLIVFLPMPLCLKCRRKRLNLTS